MSSLASNDDAVMYFTGVNLTDKEGYFYIYDATVGLVINDSATKLPAAFIAAGGTATDQSQVVLLGSSRGTYRLKSSGTIKRFQRVQLAADGTVTVDAGSGARVLVGVANEDAVSGDLFMCGVHAPVVYTA